MEVALQQTGRAGFTGLAYSASERAWYVSDDLGQVGQLGGGEAPSALDGMESAVTAFAMNASGDMIAVADSGERVKIYEHPGTQAKDSLFERSDLPVSHLEFAGDHL